jgi:secreted Zn-dependent insulinase-like peptidase
MLTLRHWQRRVKQFYEEHYSSSIMRLAVLGRHSLDELEQFVKDRFGWVQARPDVTAPPTFTVSHISYQVHTYVL